MGTLEGQVGFQLLLLQLLLPLRAGLSVGGIAQVANISLDGRHQVVLPTAGGFRCREHAILCQLLDVAVGHTEQLSNGAGGVHGAAGDISVCTHDKFKGVHCNTHIFIASFLIAEKRDTKRCLPFLLLRFPIPF